MGGGQQEIAVTLLKAASQARRTESKTLSFTINEKWHPSIEPRTY